MEQALPDPADDFDRAWAACEDLLQEAREEGAVMTVLWHPRHFSEGDFPGHRRLYRLLVERAQELGAWVGSPGQLYERERLDELPDESDDGRADAGRADRVSADGGGPERDDATGADGDAAEPDDGTAEPGDDADPSGARTVADDGRREITNPARDPDRSE
jgi:hypothetical protein